MKHKKEKKIWTKSRIKQYSDAIERLQSSLDQINRSMYEKHGYHAIRFMESRLKTQESIFEKLERKGRKVTVSSALKHIHDLAGVRVICFSVKQVYEIVEEVKQLPDITVLKEKDYIVAPKDNGYQSYHMHLLVQDTKVELQIRTIVMDAWSSIETILIYKKKKQVPEKVKEEIIHFSELSKQMDEIAEKMLEMKNDITLEKESFAEPEEQQESTQE